METKLIISPENKAIIEAIKNTGKTWYEKQIPDHPVYPQFSRKLVVTGFNTPDTKEGEDRIYVNVQQYLILKDGNIVYKKIQMPDWMIHEGNIEEVVGADGNVLTGMLTTYADDGTIISEVEEILKAQSVQYVRFLVKNKQLHIVDVLGRFMGIYMDKFYNEIQAI